MSGSGARLNGHKPEYGTVKAKIMTRKSKSVHCTCDNTQHLRKQTCFSKYTRHQGRNVELEKLKEKGQFSRVEKRMFFYSSHQRPPPIHCTQMSHTTRSSFSTHFTTFSVKKWSLFILMVKTVQNAPYWDRQSTQRVTTDTLHPDFTHHTICPCIYHSFYTFSSLFPLKNELCSFWWSKQYKMPHIGTDRAHTASLSIHCTQMPHTTRSAVAYIFLFYTFHHFFR